MLRYFCQGYSAGNAISTAATLIQSLITQLLLIHRKQFDLRDAKLTSQRFQGVQDNIEELWTLFLEILRMTETHCIWIIVDHVDIL